MKSSGSEPGLMSRSKTISSWGRKVQKHRPIARIISLVSVLRKTFSTCIWLRSLSKTSGKKMFQGLYGYQQYVQRIQVIDRDSLDIRQFQFFLFCCLMDRGHLRTQKRGQYSRTKTFIIRPREIFSLEKPEREILLKGEIGPSFSLVANQNTGFESSQCSQNQTIW